MQAIGVASAAVKDRCKIVEEQVASRTNRQEVSLVQDLAVATAQEVVRVEVEVAQAADNKEIRVITTMKVTIRQLKSLEEEI